MAKDYKKNLEIYDQLVALCPNIERKGKTMPYTSANGYMFSLFNKTAEIGIRFSKEDQEKFMEKHNTTIYHSYGAVMRGYVLIPDNMLNDLDLLAKYLQKSQDYVMTLEPK